MSDFLAVMAASSDARWRAAAALEPIDALKARALQTPNPPRLTLDGRFDLLAEVKLVAPSAGRLATPVGDRAGFVVAQALRRNLGLLSRDTLLDAYAVRRAW